MAVQDWMAEPSLQALAVNDKEFIQWPADEKGQKRIPTSLGLKLNCVPSRSLSIECLEISCIHPTWGSIHYDV